MAKGINIDRQADQPSIARIWLVTAPFAIALGILIFLYKYLDDLARGRTGTLAWRSLEEGTGITAALVVIPGAIWAAQRFRVRADTWWRVLPVHAAVAFTLSVIHTTIMGVSRHFLFPLAGLGPYDYGSMRFRYPMEMAQFVIIYAMGVTAIHLYYFVREARERQLAASELQTRLAQAQLHNLQLQLQPHFLFNALNTISSVMYEDPRRADAMLAQLSDLLRQTLRRPEAQEVTLEEEVEVLRLYLRIMLERFGEELQVEVRVEPETARALVPQLLLQPLVENSIRHGARSASPLKVEVHAARQNGNLMVKVSDNGPGIPDLEAGQFRRGVGLSNTSERLEAMYGADQEMQFENGRDGGLTVTVRLPFRALTEEP